MILAVVLFINREFNWQTDKLHHCCNQNFRGYQFCTERITIIWSNFTILHMVPSREFALHLWSRRGLILNVNWRVDFGGQCDKWLTGSKWIGKWPHLMRCFTPHSLYIQVAPKATCSTVCTHYKFYFRLTSFFRFE